MNKINKGLQEVLHFASTFFAAMFALVAGLELVYMIKYGFTSMGLILTVFFAAGAFAINKVKLNQKKQMEQAAKVEETVAERQKTAPTYKHPASIQEFIGTNKACSRCGDKLAICLEPAHGSTFPHLATGAEPGECRYYCPTCKKFFSMDEEYADFTREEPEVPQGDGRRYHFSQEYLAPLEKRKNISTIALTVGCVGIIAFLFLLQKSASNLALKPGVIISSIIASMSFSISTRTRRTLRDSEKIYYEFSEDGLIQSDGQKPSFYPWEDIRILYQVGDDFQGIAFDTTGRNFIITDYIERKAKIVERIVDKVKDHAQIDHRIFAHISQGGEQETSAANE